MPNKDLKDLGVKHSNLALTAMNCGLAGFAELASSFGAKQREMPHIVVSDIICRPRCSRRYYFILVLS